MFFSYYYFGGRSQFRNERSTFKFLYDYIEDVSWGYICCYVSKYLADVRQSLDEIYHPARMLLVTVSRPCVPLQEARLGKASLTSYLLKGLFDFKGKLISDPSFVITTSTGRN